ncbi:MAG: MipA/OmpV family protein [Pseudobdellovibrio sp.]
MASERIKLIFTLVLFFACSLRAAEEASNYKKYDHPLFEWGIFIAHGKLADYPGSDEYRYRTIPVPYISYHGDIFQTDDQDGTRVRFIKDPNFDFDLSFGGSFPTENNNDIARTGMPDLDWTLEVGPRLIYYFYRNSEVGNIRLGLPVRSAFSTNLSNLKGIGYVLAPTFQIDKYDFISKGVDLYFDFTMNFISKGEADYFYGIDRKYQTSLRPAYEAQSGFLNWETSLAAKIERDQNVLLFGVEYSDLSQSANRGSYLQRTNQNISYFVGLGRILFRSEEKADSR